MSGSIALSPIEREQLLQGLSAVNSIARKELEALSRTYKTQARFSGAAMMIYLRANQIAIQMGHAFVGLSHFLLGFSSDGEGSNILTTWRRSPEGIRKRALSHLVDDTSTADVPTALLPVSLELRAWIDAARIIASRRRPENHTVEPEDFMRAVETQPLLEGSSAQAVPRQSGPGAFKDQAVLRTILDMLSAPPPKSLHEIVVPFANEALDRLQWLDSRVIYLRDKSQRRQRHLLGLFSNNKKRIAALKTDIATAQATILAENASTAEMLDHIFGLRRTAPLLACAILCAIALGGAAGYILQP